MTDRIKALTVALDEDIRVDDVQDLVRAIKCLRHVAAVECDVADASDYTVRARVRAELKKRIWDGLSRRRTNQGSAMRRSPRSPDEPEWKRLGFTGSETCDRTPSGWAQSAHNKERCGLPANYIKVSTCGCGSNDMTMRHCFACHVEWLNKEASHQKRIEKKLIVALRRADPDLDSDEIALMHALGFTSSPRPKPTPIADVD